MPSDNSHNFDNCLVSIIMPVYNGAAYIANILTDFINQTYDKFELLIINDGSTDDTGIICESYCNRDCRIKLFNSSNKGVSVARNIGLSNANGRWIIFADCDDRITPNYVKDLFNARCENSIVIQGFIRAYQNGDKNIQYFENELIQTNTQHQKILATKQLYENGQPFGKLYDNALIIKHNIRFDSNVRFAEDLLFMLSYLLFSESIKFISDSNYIYNIYPSSGSTRQQPYESEIALLEKFCTLTEQLSLRWKCDRTPAMEYCMGLFTMRVINAIYNRHESSMTRQQRNDLIRAVHNKYADKLAKYYHPQLILQKIKKILFINTPYLFDFINRHRIIS